MYDQYEDEQAETFKLSPDCKNKIVFALVVVCLLFVGYFIHIKIDRNFFSS